MKKLNLEKLKRCFFEGCEFGDDDDVFHDGEENNRMWCAMIEALEESNKLLSYLSGARSWIGKRARKYKERFEDE